MPKAPVRVQLVAAALMWLVGSSILLVRGVAYLKGDAWWATVLAVGLGLGVLKARLLLDGVARKAVARIRARGRASFIGFFSVRSWLLIGVMMGGGITLRRLFVHPGLLATGILGAVYIGVGTALLVGDRVFWHAVLEREAGPGLSPEEA